MEDLKEKDSDKEGERWYRDLKESSPYKTLRTLRILYDKRIAVCERLKRWWDEELSNQLKRTRKTRKGKEKDGVNQEERVRRWKAEKEKMRSMVSEKEKECWKKFCKENREKDLWEVIKWAKDPWRIRQVMKTLRNTENKKLDMDEEKAKGLIQDYFVWNEEG